MNKFQDVFISYGRADSKAFAKKLNSRLVEQGLEVWFDFDDIPLGVDYQNQIDDGIEKADNFLFIIAPHSINSPYCLKEIELALKRKKRIVPLLHVELLSKETWQQRFPFGTEQEWEVYKAQGKHSSFANMHPEIGKINWVYLRENIDDFEPTFQGLLAILERQKLYVHQHTVLLAKALEWERHQKQSQYLLIGEEREEAEQWLKERFKEEQAPCTPSELHCEYITESIKNANNLMTQVFISYADEDRAIMEKIRNSLRRESITVWTNKTDIQTGEAFDEAIKRGIEQADNLVFLLSPDAVKSSYCQRELDLAVSLNKRIIPVLVSQTDPDQVPIALHSLQYINLTDNVLEDDYLLDESQLLKILHEDAAYYNEHKVLLTKALKWKRQNENPSILLRGYNLRSAETWLKVAQKRTQHRPIELQEEFITQSLQQPPLESIDIFISYSRADSDFARKLNDTLQMQGKTTWFDQESIASGSDFQQEIYRGIKACDNFLFILSPRSVNSPYCKDEVEYAASLNKRFVTVLHREVNPGDLHPELAKVQWIDFNQNERDFNANFNQLLRSLDTDREYVHSHTKWLHRAIEWQEKDRSADLLLRGKEFAAAQNWLKTALAQNKQPVPTGLQQTFIDESYKAIIAAQEAEKNRQALLRLQKMFLGAVSMGFAIATVLGGISFYQSIKASQLQNKANEAEVKALARYSDALFASNKRLDALLVALKAKGLLQNLKGASTELTQEVDGVLQKTVFGSRQYHRFSGHQATVFTVAVSPDGQMIASGSDDNTVKLWNRDGKLLKTLTDHKDSVYSVAFSPDGKLMASASVDKTIKLWRRDGTLLKTLTGHQDRVKAVAFSRDGKLIASGSDDRTVKLWQPDGTLVKTLKGHSDKVQAVAFSPNGKLIVSGSDDRTVKLWQPDGTLVKTLTGHQKQVKAVAFSPDGQWIASASDDNTIRLWKSDGTFVKTFDGHSDQVTGVAFSPDSQTIASASWDGTVKQWNLDGTLLATLFGHGDKVTDVAFSPDGQTIVSASEDKTLALWKCETPFVKILFGHQKPVNAVAFSPDRDKEKRLIASASDDQTVKLWQSNGRLLVTIPQTDKVNDVSFSPDGQTIVTGSRDKKITLWNRDGIRLQKPIFDADQVNQVLFSPDGQVIASASDDKTVKLWRRDGTRLKVLKGHTDKVTTIAFSADGKLIASGSADNSIKLWNRNGHLLRNLTVHNGSVINNMSFSPDGKLIASGSADNFVALWKLDGISPTFLFRQKHNESVNAVVFSPDGKTIASASADKTVKLWNRNGKLLNTFYVHTDEVNDIAFSQDSQTVASASSDNTVMLWNVNKVVLPSEDLQIYGCDLLRDYLRTNTEKKLDESDKHICDGIGTQK
ncbi:TIR domain-containing protein [Aerosakkonemataceae cyanobacterium BLCC-F50]|uniref:TIR domain-containing protein n=1 Tax=Floridaenema flaviceps BLCC-F50 TaxID=3153642 RepID=A0ABV4XUU4_9CYAN